MGAEDRDWYRGWWRNKTGHVERALFRVALGGPRAFKREAPGAGRFILPAILTFVLCVLVFAALRLLAKLR
jgi:hypothetical protein